MGEGADTRGLPDRDDTSGSIDESPSRGSGTSTDRRTVTVRHLAPDPEGRRAGDYSAQSRGPEGTGGPDDDGTPTVTAGSAAASAPEGDLGPVAPGP
jgi:hypothetical protein